MGRVVIVAVIGAIIASMAIAMFFFMEYRPVVSNVNAGEQITVGPNTYTLHYQGLQTGSEKVNSTDTFMVIGIDAYTPNGKLGTAEKRQFTLLDTNNTRTAPTYGIVEESGSVTAYFPINGDQLDEKFEYKVMIRPTKEQKSTDVALVCIANC